MFYRVIALSLLGMSNLLVEAHAEEIDFDQQVKPIFVARCHSCHGSEKQESGLRLDDRDSALQGGDSGAALVANDPETSLLIKYVSGVDPDHIMPPEGDRLTDEQVDILRQWIRSGANWPESDKAVKRNDHWAYQPLIRHPVPEVRHQDLVRNPVDAFVLARLEAEGIEPSPEADRTTLIKRLYYDLLGLPPTLEAVQRFVTDETPEAYEHVVDELLDSPHFGERWGRHWLDKARYADSDGYEKDRPRYHAWKFRDWVIQAINDDMPFDEFTIEQFAGDLLPNATQSQLQATAFHRQTLTNTEGGTDQEEFRVEAVFDRVETLGSVWLGLTVGCARCHSHKYDDISQREYYQLFAYFNNADEQDLQLPSSPEADAKYVAEKAVFDAKLAELNAPLQQAIERVKPGFSEWQQQLLARLESLKSNPLREAKPQLVQATADSGAMLSEVAEDHSWLASGPVGATDIYNIEWIASGGGQELTLLQLDLLTDASLPANGPGRADNGNFVLSELTLDVVESDGTLRRVPFAAAKADFAQGGFDPAQLIDGDERKMGWAIAPQMGNAHQATLTLKEPLKLSEGQKVQVRLVQHYERDGLTPHAIGRFRISLWSGNSPESLGIPQEIQDILAISAEKRKPDQATKLMDYFVHLDADVQKLRKSVDQHQKQAPFNPAMPIAVMQERSSNRRTTKILKRGEFLDPLGEVSPGTLHVLPPVAPGSEQPTRLDLAHWLVSPENPLTPRVTVNEMWSHLFGQGLVSTSNDFGVRGERPTHPELLDWLATELHRLGWSRKQFLRTIVMSHTYRQDSRHRAELTDHDPQNHLLARQNRFRVEAEIVRDLYLAASGLLEPRIGGPSVFPQLPPGIAELSYANNFRWGDSDWNSRPDRPWTVTPQNDIHRRGMYTFFKRTAAHPNLVTFDCPDSNTTCVERRSSNTPLQALQTLNNATFVEASRTLGERIAELPGDDTDRLQHLFQRCVARTPNSDELAALADLLTESRTYYASHGDDAKLLSGGAAASAGQQAPWILLARTVLNLDEFVTRE